MKAENNLLETFRRSVTQLNEGAVKEKGILLLDKFEEAESIPEVINQLKKIKGCSRFGLHCEWILKKVELNSNEITNEEIKNFKEMLINAITFTEKSGITKPAAPRLIDIIDRNLFTGFQRFSDIVSHLANKSPQERKTTFGVLAMISRSSLDVAKKQQNKMIEEFFEAVLTFIVNVDKYGATHDNKVTEIMKEVGVELNVALNSESDPKESFAKVLQILQEPIGSSK